MECLACHAPMRDGARFCTACGAPSRAHERVVRRRSRDQRAEVWRPVTALAVCCLGTYASLLLLSVLAPGKEWTQVVLHAVALLATAGAAAAVGGELWSTLPWRAHPAWYLAAPPLGFGMLVVGTLWLRAMGVTPEPAVVSMAAWVSAVVVAPIGEEWLCRGVAFRAAERLAPQWTVVLMTAGLFALLHGLGGGWIAELPHRFIYGLALGWLRWRSGSLLPPLLAHACLNALAQLWAG